MSAEPDLTVCLSKLGSGASTRGNNVAQGVSDPCEADKPDREVREDEGEEREGLMERGLVQHAFFEDCIDDLEIEDTTLSAWLRALSL